MEFRVSALDGIQTDIESLLQLLTVLHKTVKQQVLNSARADLNYLEVLFSNARDTLF
jgi:hypothetical protein